VDEIIDHWPWRCACGHRFSEAERRPLGRPARHQVTELPAITVTLSEHRLLRIPPQAEHRFRSKPNTDSTASRTPIPE
jgi:hypothetical protein